MNLNVLILPGDGIGTEVTREAVRVLEHVCEKYKHKLNQREGLLGGIAIHKTGTPFPDETAKLAAGSRRDPDGRGRTAGVRQRAAREAAGERDCSAFARRWAFMRICGRCGRTRR